MLEGVVGCLIKDLLALIEESEEAQEILESEN